MVASSVEVGKILPMVTSLYNSFTKREKVVADTVMKEPQQIIYTTITDFAEMADVGDTTIIRFCRKLGFKGYQSFKMSLAQELSLNNNNGALTSLNEEILEDDTVEIVLQKLYSTCTGALQETVSLLNNSHINKAVEMMRKSNRIRFYGVGTSGVTALDAKYRFMRIGINVDCLTDGHMMGMDAALLNSQDLAIGITHSGSTKDTIEALKIAKESGANTICITHHSRSPITKYADVVLLTGFREGPLQGGALGTKIAQIFVIETLFVEIFKGSKEKYIKNKKKTSDAIADKML